MPSEKIDIAISRNGNYVKGITITEIDVAVRALDNGIELTDAEYSKVMDKLVDQLADMIDEKQDGEIDAVLDEYIDERESI